MELSDHHIASTSIIDQAKAGFINYASRPWRTHQKEAVEFILESKKKFVILEASTGSGKSLIAMAAGRAHGSLTYAVHTKVLQQQVVSDFPEAKVLYGRRNYICAADDTLSCDECKATKKSPCEFVCPYQAVKKEVLKSQLKILNYDYLLSEINYAGHFSRSSFNVIDEADNLETTLINFTTLQFTPYALNRLNLTEPSRKTADSKLGIEPWKEFGLVAQERVRSLIKSLAAEIESYGERENITEQQIRKIKELSKITHLSERIDIFLSKVDSTWFYEEVPTPHGNKIIFRPLWVTEDLANNFLWRHASKWVLMSASFLPLKIQCKVLGIPLDQVDYRLVPSTFPADRKPIYVSPVANMTAKTSETELPKLYDAIGSLLSRYNHSKGIIHTASYKLATQICTNVNSSRLITHNTSDRQDVLDKFKLSSEPLVLVSPSMERGVSLPDDDCRFIILVKCLFLSLGDKITSLRLYTNKQFGNIWYKSIAAQAIIQASGRGMRHKDDQCEVWLIDEQIKKLIMENISLFPEYWRESLVFGEEIGECIDPKNPDCPF